MAHQSAAAVAVRHPVLPDTAKASIAKAGVRVPDINWMREIGQALQRAIHDVGWTNKEALTAIYEATGKEIDDAEFGKWFSGGRRPQLDQLFAVERLREPMVIRLAGLAKGEVVTEIRFRRGA